MRIGELARRAGVKVSTVRFYERHGILAEPARTPGGYRDYDEETLTYLRFLRRGQELGFCLAELGEFSEMSAQSGSGRVTGAAVSAAAERKLSEIDGKLADLRRTRDAIAGLLSDQCPDLSAPCPIIAALAGAPDSPAEAID
jgi:MerR family mercuric resistance operon transcriptional regulator